MVLALAGKDECATNDQSFCAFVYMLYRIRAVSFSCNDAICACNAIVAVSIRVLADGMPSSALSALYNVFGCETLGLSTQTQMRLLHSQFAPFFFALFFCLWIETETGIDVVDRDG
jgi:hypothetical protein